MITAVPLSQVSQQQHVITKPERKESVVSTKSISTQSIVSTSYTPKCSTHFAYEYDEVWYKRIFRQVWRKCWCRCKQ